MIKLNLETANEEQKLVKEFLEQNVSDLLAYKINNGVKITKDNKTLINRKDLDNFMIYATQEAQKLAENGARSACVRSDTVFSWAMHFFEEDTLEGNLFNEDGSVYTANRKIKSTENRKISTPLTPKAPQISLFDFEDKKLYDSPPNETPSQTDDIPYNTNTSEIEDEEFSQKEIEEVLEELAQEESQNIDYETGEIFGVQTEEHIVIQKLFDIFKDKITLRL